MKNKKAKSKQRSQLTVSKHIKIKKKINAKLKNHSKKKEVRIDKLPLKTKLTAIKAHHIPHLAKISSIQEMLFILNDLKDNQKDKFIAECKKRINHLPQKEIIEPILQKNDTTAQIQEALKIRISELLKDEHSQLYDKITELRKSGKDVYFPQLEIMAIPFKIRLFSITGQKFDFYKVRKKLDNLHSEISKI